MSETALCYERWMDEVRKQSVSIDIRNISIVGYLHGHNIDD